MVWATQVAARAFAIHDLHTAVTANVMEAFDRPVGRAYQQELPARYRDRLRVSDLGNVTHEPRADPPTRKETSPFSFVKGWRKVGTTRQAERDARRRAKGVHLIRRKDWQVKSTHL
jgi:hypothetical protein